MSCSRSRGVSSLARISYVRQKEPLGLGHAVLCAKDLVGNEPFAVILPDDVIEAVIPARSTRPTPSLPPAGSNAASAPERPTATFAWRLRRRT